MMDSEISNAAALNVWEREAVGSQRAGDASLGSPEYFERIRSYRYGYETPFIPSTFRFEALSGKRVLEVGVGNGIDAVEMIRHGAVYTGIDISRNHLRLARRHIELKRATAQLEGLIEGDLLDTELPRDYDVIYSFGVLHHIAHESAYLRKLRGLLKPGGELRIGIYSRWSFFNFYLVATWLLKNRMRNSLNDWSSHIAERSELGQPVVIKIRSYRQIMRVLREAGFVPIHYEKRGFVKNYIPVVGRWLASDGVVLSICAHILGWYHCIIAVPDTSLQ
jgi:2-polyprenyl-3-methyl-5-hydroxy-6-metoxy-1,4-benzoquinol methylase